MTKSTISSSKLSGVQKVKSKAQVKAKGTDRRAMKALESTKNMLKQLQTRVRVLERTVDRISKKKSLNVKSKVFKTLAKANNKKISSSSSASSSDTKQPLNRLTKKQIDRIHEIFATKKMMNSQIATRMGVDVKQVNRQLNRFQKMKELAKAPSSSSSSDSSSSNSTIPASPSVSDRMMEEL